MTTLVWELTFALERYVKLPEVDLPAVHAGTSPSNAAELLRRHWNLPDGPVKHLVATAESRGIVIAVRPLGEIDAVDAFSVVIVDRPIIVTTPRRSENVFRHRFSIAHEIGHLLLHAESGEHNAAIEREADEFAAAFLTPASSMDAALPQRLDLAALDRLGRTWGSHHIHWSVGWSSAAAPPNRLLDGHTSALPWSTTRPLTRRARSRGKCQLFWRRLPRWLRTTVQACPSSPKSSKSAQAGTRPDRSGRSAPHAASRRRRMTTAELVVGVHRFRGGSIRTSSLAVVSAIQLDPSDE